MIRWRRNDEFSKYTNEVYEEDTDYFCAICGYGIHWPKEEIVYDESGNMCHEWCMENLEEENE